MNTYKVDYSTKTSSATQSVTVLAMNENEATSKVRQQVRDLDVIFDVTKVRSS